MKKFIAIALAAMLALSLVACGAKPAATTGTTPTLDAIKAKGTLTMMTATGFPPFEYLGSDGKPAGVDIDIAQMIADELGVKLEVLDMDFGLLIESLKSGKGDIIAAGMSATEERKTQIDFSDSYASTGLAVVVPMDSKITSTDAIKDAGTKVCVQESTTAHIYMQEEVKTEPMAFKTSNECATAVIAGKAECILVDKLVAQSLVNANKDTLKVLDGVLSEEKFVLGIAKDKQDFVDFVNGVLAKAVADKKVDESLQKHDAICAEG